MRTKGVLTLSVTWFLLVLVNRPFDNLFPDQLKISMQISAIVNASENNHATLVYNVIGRMDLNLASSATCFDTKTNTQ